MILVWLIAVGLVGSDQVNSITLLAEPPFLTLDSDKSLKLSCYLDQTPKINDTVYIIWRFRRRGLPEPPSEWAFMHPEDDVARCPKPPKICEFFNQFVELFHQGQAVSNDWAGNVTEREWIESRRLHTLVLHKISVDLDGIYQCHVLINLESREARIKVEVLSSPLQAFVISNQEVQELGKHVQKGTSRSKAEGSDVQLLQFVTGKNHLINCKVVRANPQPSVEWFVFQLAGNTSKIRRLLTAPQKSVRNPSDTEVYMDVQSTEDFTQYDDGGFIQCQAKNSVGQVSSKALPIVVSYPPQIKPFPNDIEYAMENVTFEYECLVSAKPAPHIKWLSGRTHTVISNSSLLKVFIADSSGENVFTCVATNSLGESRQSLELKILAPPLVRLPGKVLANEGENLEIVCSVQASPMVEKIYWTHNDRKIPVRSKEFEKSIHSNGARLIFPLVRVEQEGRYSCHAMHTADTMDKIARYLAKIKNISPKVWTESSIPVATTQLFVRYKPGTPSISVRPGNTVHRGTTIEIKCTTNQSTPGFPKPRFHWIRTDVMLSLKSTQDVIKWQHLLTQEEEFDDSVLTLNEPNMTDSGFYGCYASNSLGDSEAAMQAISIQDQPQLLETHVDPNNFVAASEWSKQEWRSSYASNENVLLACHFLSNPKAKIEWRYKVPHGIWRSLTDSGIHLVRSNTEIDISTVTRNIPGLELCQVSSTLRFLHPTTLRLYERLLRRNEISGDGKTLWRISNSLLWIAKILRSYQMMATYVCVANNEKGTMKKTWKTGLSHLPWALPLPDDTTVRFSKKLASGKSFYGPFLCHFVANPPIRTISWWIKRSNVGKLLVQVENIREQAYYKRTSDLIIFIGRHPIRSSLMQQFHRSIHYNIELALNHSHTIYSALWIRAEQIVSDLRNIECVASNILGNTSQEIKFTEMPGPPHKPEQLTLVNISWTSILLHWRAGFHGRYQQTLLDSNTPPSNNLGNLHATLESFYHRWEADSEAAQTFQLELSELSHSKSDVSWQSGLSTTQTQPQYTVLLDMSGDNLINISGLLPSHRYTVRVRGVNLHGEGPYCEPIEFRTKGDGMLFPSTVIADSSLRKLRIPSGNPGLCTQLFTSRNRGVTWQLEPLVTNPRTLLINGMNAKEIKLQGRHSSDPNCLPLSWTSATLISLPNDGWIRIRFCNVGNLTDCGEPVQPSRDLPTFLLLVSGILCVLLLVTLSWVFFYLICMRRGKCPALRTERRIFTNAVENVAILNPQILENEVSSPATGDRPILQNQQPMLTNFSKWDNHEQFPQLGDRLWLQSHR